MKLPPTIEPVAQKVKFPKQSEIYLATRESTTNYVTDGDKTYAITDDELTAIDQLHLIDSAVRSFLSSGNKSCTIERNDKGVAIRLKFSPEVQALRRCVYFDIDAMCGQFPNHEFSPYIDLFIKNMKTFQLDQMPTLKYCSVLSDDIDHWSTVVNEFGGAMRTEAKTTEFAARVKHKRDASTQICRELMACIKSIFKNHGRVLVLRIDTGYRKVSDFDRAGTDISYKEAKRHLKAFIARTKKLFKSTRLGYAWKFEYGQLKGYHTHFLLFLDGSKVREDKTIGKMLGEYWNSFITEGRGVYYNCNNNKDSYRHCGIGMLSHKDPEIWEGLKRIALYMTKTDYFVRLNMQDRDRAFGRSRKFPDPVKKLGRPRNE